MKRKFFDFDYIDILKYITLFAGYIVLNCLEKTVYPYSCALLIAFSYLNPSYIIAPVLYVVSFLVTADNGLIPQAGCSAIIIFFITLLYGKTRTKKNFAYLTICALSVFTFLVIGNTDYKIVLEKRIIVCLITFFLSFVCSFSLKAVCNKGLKYKFSYEEILSLAGFAVCLGLGICNLLGVPVWKGISVFTVLLGSYLFGSSCGTFISAVLGISVSVYYGNIEYVSLFVLWGVASDITVRFSGYVSALSIPTADFLAYHLFATYPYYGIGEYLPVLIGSFLFIAIPYKPLKTLKEKLYVFREKQLVRQTINRNRLMLSNRLYELAGVFAEMSSAFITFKEKAVSEETAKALIKKDVLNTVCANCKLKDKCKPRNTDISKGFDTMLDIGFAKGKLSLIDLPKESTAVCIRPNELLFGLNRKLAEYRNYTVAAKNLSTGRELLAEEAEGVSDMLKGLALESGSLLKYRSNTEKAISEELLKSGIYASEVLVYGENERVTVSMIINMREFSLKAVNDAIERAVGFEMSLFDKNGFTEDKVYLAFKKSVSYDAVFGVAKSKKDGSEKSGDNYSVIRISEEKFLVALSDGMGSGENADRISSVSLSLIESFYKAGMNSTLILNTVNKILSVNTEDSFTALDVSVIDLKTHKVDFVKYGSPNGYIVGEGRVRIVEGNTLPLGILKDLKPSVCTAELNDGDMILLISDGVADAFGSSGDVIEFLRVVPALNPQSLADGIVNKAFELSGGKNKDDMTALAVRYFKKQKAV